MGMNLDDCMKEKKKRREMKSDMKNKQRIKMQTQILSSFDQTGQEAYSSLSYFLYFSLAPLHTNTHTHTHLDMFLSIPLPN